MAPRGIRPRRPARRRPRRPSLNCDHRSARAPGRPPRGRRGDRSPHGPAALARELSAARRVRADPRDRDQELPGPGVLHPVRVDGADAPPRRPDPGVPDLRAVLRCQPRGRGGVLRSRPRRPTRIAAWSAGSSTGWGGIGVARPEDDDFIKRVAPRRGYLGDPPRQAVRERRPSASPTSRTRYRNFGPETVPDGMLFVLGDNRLHSGDSRFPRRGAGLRPQGQGDREAFVIAWPLDGSEASADVRPRPLRARPPGPGVLLVAGADEAGRGALAGPLVAAAADPAGGIRPRGDRRLEGPHAHPTRGGLRTDRGVGRLRRGEGGAGRDRPPGPAPIEHRLLRRCVRALDPTPEYALTDGFPCPACLSRTRDQEGRCGGGVGRGRVDRREGHQGPDHAADASSLPRLRIRPQRRLRDAGAPRRPRSSRSHADPPALVRVRGQSSLPGLGRSVEVTTWAIRV